MKIISCVQVCTYKKSTHYRGVSDVVHMADGVKINGGVNSHAFLLASVRAHEECHVYSRAIQVSHK